jgi:hypothetical protein
MCIVDWPLYERLCPGCYGLLYWRNKRASSFLKSLYHGFLQLIQVLNAVDSPCKPYGRYPRVLFQCRAAWKLAVLFYR